MEAVGGDKDDNNEEVSEARKKARCHDPPGFVPALLKNRFSFRVLADNIALCG